MLIWLAFGMCPSLACFVTILAIMTPVAIEELYLFHHMNKIVE